MRTRKIILSSDEVTTYTPVADHSVPLLSIKTPKGATYRYPNPFNLILKLYDGSDDQIPHSSYLVIGKTRPGQDYPTFIRKISYAGYYDLSESNQRDQKYVQATLHDLGSEIAAISCPEDHVLNVYAHSSVVVDTSKDDTRFETTVQEIN
jgi:hypothetical protein